MTLGFGTSIASPTTVPTAGWPVSPQASLAVGAVLPLSQYRPGPFAVPAPPTPAQTEQELAYMQQVQATRTAQGDQWATLLDKYGDKDIWQQFAKQYRDEAGFWRGWIATGLLDADMGAAAIENWLVKEHFKRPRPYAADPNITVVGPKPGDNDESYSSGHSASAFAAATFMSAIWPARAWEFNWWAQQVGLARVYSGDHYPSDVIEGATLGRKVGSAFAMLAGQ